MSYTGSYNEDEPNFPPQNNLILQKMVWHRQGSEFQGLFKATTKIQDFPNHGSIKHDYFQTPHKGCNQSTQMAFNKFQKVSPSLYIFLGRGVVRRA